MSLFKLMEGPLKSSIRSFRVKRKNPETNKEKPSPDSGLGTKTFAPSCPTEEDVAVQVPENVVASALQFDKVATKGQLSNVLLWMLAQDQIQNDAKSDQDFTTAFSNIMDEDQLTAWLKVSLCVESSKLRGKLKGLRKAAKELGLIWEDDLSWRLGRLVLFFGGEFPDQAVTASSRDQMQVSLDSCMSTMLTELQGLLNLAKSLEPNDNGKNHQWSTLKDAVVKEIAHYSSLTTLESLLSLPPHLKVLLNSKKRWYYSLENVRHESRKRSSRFLKSLASDDLKSGSSTSVPEKGRPISNKAPVSGPDVGDSTDTRSWSPSIDTKLSVPLPETRDQQQLLSKVSELNARVEGLERESRSSSRAQQHSHQQRENSHSSLSTLAPGSYNRTQEFVPMPHAVQQGVPQPQSVAASNYTPAPLPTENVMCGENWPGYNQRQDTRSRIPRPVKPDPFFSHYGQADAHLPRVTSSPLVDPAHGGPFIVPATVPMTASPSMVSMHSTPLINQCYDGYSRKPELAADFIARERGMRAINHLQIDDDDVERRRMENLRYMQGIEDSRFQEMNNKSAPQYNPQYRPPTRQYASHPGMPRRSATIRSGRYDTYSEYPADHYEQDSPPMRQRAPSPGMQHRRPTTRGYRHDQDRDYGTFDQRDSFIQESGYTVHPPRTMRPAVYEDVRRRVPSADPWELPRRHDPVSVLTAHDVQRHVSPAYGVHLLKPSKVTPLQRSKSKKKKKA
ncbi:hypothetical protein HDK77DRAFT_135776 [Phyllosticta capitalensis]